MDHKTFKELRNQAGLSQFDLSKRSGVERSRLSLFECGHVELGDEEIKGLEQALSDSITERATRLMGMLPSCRSQSRHSVECLGGIAV